LESFESFEKKPLKNRLIKMVEISDFNIKETTFDEVYDNFCLPQPFLMKKLSLRYMS
jgi:hypothetical protein